MSKDKISTMNEDKTRQKLIRYAQLIGAEGDLKQAFAKWDTFLAHVPQGPERTAMSRQAILEVQSLLDIHAEQHNGLTINGEIIISGAGKDNS